MSHKFDASKYTVKEDMPEKFAQVIPGMGVQHFSKKHLSDNDLKALVKAKSKYVTQVQDSPEDKPAYTDIGKGEYPS
jgi:hypothetical protein